MTVSEDCKFVTDWLREPDYAENFTFGNLTEWINRRPIAAVARLAAALSDQPNVEQFISDMADSANEVVGTARQKEIFKASLRLAISHARRKAAHRVAVPPPSSTAGEG